MRVIVLYLSAQILEILTHAGPFPEEHIKIFTGMMRFMRFRTPMKGLRPIATMLWDKLLDYQGP